MAASPELFPSRKKKGELAPNEAVLGADLFLVPSDYVTLVRTVYTYHKGVLCFHLGTWLPQEVTGVR